MENFNSTSSSNKLSFWGQGSTYFGIVAVNVLLTLVTLGLYYPWAKAAYRKYIWNETEFIESRFVFNGTGKEMFKGFLIMYAIFIGFYTTFFVLATLSYGFIFFILFYLLLILLIPIAISADGSIESLELLGEEYSFTSMGILKNS